MVRAEGDRLVIGVVLCLVVAISDGDTLKARCGEMGAYEQVTVRLAEVDAPEKGQPYATRSRASLAALCFGAWAQISGEKTDRYRRTVARVKCRGHDASEEQARRGMAWAYTRYLTDPTIRALAAEARHGHLGLWADTSPVPPWEYRRRSKIAEDAEGAHR